NNLQKKTLFFLILSFLFCVNSVYSFECCYVGGSIGINTDGSTCSERGLPKVGDENGDLCKSIIEEARRTCQASEQIFRNTIGGNLIFQIGDVIYPQVADPSNEKPLCIALVEYNPNYS